MFKTLVIFVWFITSHYDPQRVSESNFRDQSFIPVLIPFNGKTITDHKQKRTFAVKSVPRDIQIACPW